MYALQPIHENVLSYYGKAKVSDTNGVIKLYSYGTHVATYESEYGTAVIGGIYSATTTRHQTEFLRQRGLNGEQIAAIFDALKPVKDYRKSYHVVTEIFDGCSLQTTTCRGLSYVYVGYAGTLAEFKRQVSEAKRRHTGDDRLMNVLLSTERKFEFSYAKALDNGEMLHQLHRISIVPA